VKEKHEALFSWVLFALVAVFMGSALVTAFLGETSEAQRTSTSADTESHESLSSDNSEFFQPLGYVNAGKGLAWKAPSRQVDCLDDYARTCLPIEVISETDCPALHAEIGLENPEGRRIDTFFSGRNIQMLAGSPMFVPFSSSSELSQGADFKFVILSLSCSEEQIDELTYAETFSSLNIDPEFCAGPCSPLQQQGSNSSWGSIDWEKSQPDDNSWSEPAPSRRVGYRVRCNDGTFSNAGGRQGACSWHGGVSD